MTLTRYRNKIYVIIGPWEIQYGRVSRSISLFHRHPWRRLFTIG